ERDLRVLRSRGAVLRDAERADGRRVDDAAHAVLGRRLEDRARAAHVGAVERVGIRRPEAVVRRDVEDGVGPPHGPAHGGGVEQVTLGDLDGQACERAPVPARAREHAHRAAVTQELADQVRADEACAAGDECLAHARALATRPRARATAWRPAPVPLRRVIASAIARGRASTARTARSVRTRPSGSTTAARSAGTPRSAVSLTARITAAGISCARAHSRITADSMSHASAPASTQSRAFALGVATTSSTVTSVPTRRRPATSAVAWRAPVGPTTVSGTTRSPSARSGERAPQTPADTTNAGGAMRD